MGIALPLNYISDVETLAKCNSCAMNLILIQSLSSNNHNFSRLRSTITWTDITNDMYVHKHTHTIYV